jgi:hypothetical protein
MKQLLLSLGLLSSIATPLLTTTIAQAAPKPITCDATTSLGNGASLIYKITGNLEVTAQGQVLPPQQDLSGLSITVQRRDRKGTLQTLLNRAPLANFERVAPDADYSQLPFSPTFRGKPNNGQGLYSTSASPQGLYLSLRPTSSLPQQAQIVHYLSAKQSVRSAVGACRAST